MKEKFRYALFILTASEKRQFWIQVVFNIFITIADIATLALLLLIINFYISNAGNNSLGFLPSWMLNKDSAALIAVFFIVFASKNMLAIIVSNAQFHFIGKVAVRISKQKLDSYMQGSYYDFVNIDSAEHIRKIAFQPFEFCQHILSGFQQIIIHGFLIVLSVITIVIFNAKLFLLLFLVLLPPVALVFFYIKRKVSMAKKRIHMANENSIRFLLDALKGYIEGNIYQRTSFFSERFVHARNEFSKHMFTSLSVQTIPGRIIESFAVLGLFILIVIVKWMGINDSATLITIGAFMAAAYKIIPGIVKIINEATQMKAYDFSLYDLQSPNPVEKKITSPTVPVESLEFKNVSFAYQDQPVINNLSFFIQGGDLVGISGRSGKGKTTILNLLLGFLDCKNGEILVNGAITSSIKNYWPAISYVRQQPFLFHDTILKNIVLDEKPHDPARLSEALEHSGLKDFLTSQPGGINKIITESGKNISGGQQQRIAIARAIYKDADLIILDEPFNELDEASATSLVKYFQHLSSVGKIVIMVTHDSQSLSYCNKIISLDAE